MTTTTQNSTSDFTATVKGHTVSGIRVADKGPYTFTIGDGFIEFCRRNSLPAWEGEMVYDGSKAIAYDAVSCSHCGGRIIGVKFGTQWRKADLKWQPFIIVKRECELPADQHKVLVAKAIEKAEKRHATTIATMRKYAP